MCMLLSESSFTGGIQLYVLGFPFICLATALLPHHIHQILLTPVEKMNSPDETILHVRYLLLISHPKNISEGKRNIF